MLYFSYTFGGVDELFATKYKIDTHEETQPLPSNPHKSGQELKEASHPE